MKCRQTPLWGEIKATSSGRGFFTPTFSKKDLQDVEENLRLLIKQKDKLYPEVMIQIVDVHIKEINGKDYITVTSMNVA